MFRKIWNLIKSSWLLMILAFVILIAGIHDITGLSLGTIAYRGESTIQAGRKAVSGIGSTVTNNAQSKSGKSSKPTNRMAEGAASNDNGGDAKQNSDSSTSSSSDDKKNEIKPDKALANSVMTDNVKAQLGGTDKIDYDDAGAFQINNGMPTINANVKSAPYVQLSKLNSKGQAGQANALLNNNSRQYKSREETNNDGKIYPPGFKNQKTNDPYRTLYNRGHLIGYANAGSVKGFDASEANKRNIVTQTAWANQASMNDSMNTGQNYYEGIVRKGQDDNQIIRYQVTPIYDGDNKVPSGNHMQALSQDGSVSFNVFIPNVQPGFKINYKTGDAQKE